MFTLQSEPHGMYCLNNDHLTSRHWTMQQKVMYLTFRGSCIVIYSYNKNQRDALFLKFFLYRTLHVSDRFTIHHQESSTVYIAIGICHLSSYTRVGVAIFILVSSLFWPYLRAPRYHMILATLEAFITICEVHFCFPVLCYQSSCLDCFHSCRLSVSSRQDLGAALETDKNRRDIVPW